MKTATEVDTAARAQVGETWDRGKRICRMLAARKTPEDDEAAGFLGAMIFRMLNAEAAETRMRRLLEELSAELMMK